MAVEIDIWLDG